MEKKIEENIYNHIRTSYLLKDGTWYHVNKDSQNEYWHNGGWQYVNENKWTEQHSYLYFTRSGNNQSCIATISVEEREWITNEGDRRIDKDIAVEFSGELGTEAGSWKGGVTGCTFLMRDGETPLQTLRRMEMNRAF